MDVSQNLISKYISIHSPRMRGDDKTPTKLRGLIISIHSPRMRGDRPAPEPTAEEKISIHSPRMRGDFRRTIDSNPSGLFQSTPLA